MRENSKRVNLCKEEWIEDARIEKEERERGNIYKLRRMQNRTTLSL